MSVIMMLSMQGDPAALQQYAAENPGKLEAIRDHAVEHGLLAHRFYGGDGQVLVVDEWPDEESFQGFFAHVQDEVGAVMQAVGVTGDVAPTFWRKLDVGDEYGWDT